MPNKIRVHERALGHLSRGLYRSPASALRELVSNAWDADATVVRIDTNYPNFFQISVEDNGDGFSKAEFERLMEGGIGNSPKRPADATSVHERPLIGRLGIGLLGIAQICGAFTISSVPKSGEAFKARVRLWDLLRTRLDAKDQQVVHEDGAVTIVEIGEYEFEESDVKKQPGGTRIIADAVHPTFSHAFQQSLKFEKYQQPPLDWGKALRIVSDVRSLQELGDYWRLLWELSASCPVPYLSGKALPDGLIADDQKQLTQYDFAVFVDGIRLAKPVYLHGNPGGYTTRKIGRQKERVYARDLVFHGYVLVQEGTQLHPDELRGILIRIKNVGIGYYDPSMLDYRINEGPRSRWLTGEILVDEGLEDALNIDRDSFNRFHPEYRAVQSYLHKLLQEKIFPRVYEQIDVRSEEKAKKKKKVRREQLKKVVAQATGTAVRLRFEGGVAGAEEAPRVEVKQSKEGTELVMPEPSSLKTKKAYRELAAAVLSLFETALRETTRERQRETFTRLLLELLSEW
jgi:hypothetical protein